MQLKLNGYARWFERVKPRMLVPAALFALAAVGLARVNVDEDFV
ncbi:MAG: hypothetical protein R3E86_12545 [Pseudomonadales bacterium]